MLTIPRCFTVLCSHVTLKCKKVNILASPLNYITNWDRTIMRQLRFAGGRPSNSERIGLPLATKQKVHWSLPPVSTFMCIRLWCENPYYWTSYSKITRNKYCWNYTTTRFPPWKSEKCNSIEKQHSCTVIDSIRFYIIFI